MVNMDEYDEQEREEESLLDRELAPKSARRRERTAEKEKPRRAVIDTSREEQEDVTDVETELKALFNSQSDITYKASVLRYNPTTKTFLQVTSYSDITDANEIPSPEEIGRAFGGGKYKILISYAQKNGTIKRWSRVFDLDKVYDKYLIPQAPTIPTTQPQQQLDSTQFMMMMMQQSEKASERMLQMQNENQKMMMGMMTAIIPAMMSNKSDVNTDLLREVINANKTDKVAETKAMLSLIKEAKSIGEPDYDDEEEEEEEVDPKAELMSSLMGAAGKFLGIQQPEQPQPLAHKALPKKHQEDEQEVEDEDEYDDEDDYEEDDESGIDDVSEPVTAPKLKKRTSEQNKEPEQEPEENEDGKSE